MSVRGILAIPLTLIPLTRRSGQTSGCSGLGVRRSPLVAAPPRYGSSRIRSLTRILAGILFFALLFNSVPAFSATDPQDQSVTLAWSASPDTNVVGYNIYYGGASGDYTNMINVGDVTSATISGLTAGATYYFTATAYDDFGQESAYSSEISYTVPEALPTVQIRSAPAGQFMLTVSGLTGHTYDIQATQDLMTWTVIGTVTVGDSGSLDFTDSDAANFPQRFYRTQDNQ